MKFIEAVLEISIILWQVLALVVVLLVVTAPLWLPIAILVGWLT